MAGRRVLVVDDSETIRKIVATTLRVSGYEVDAAADGAGGLEVLARQEVALVITDLLMPVMGGLEFIRRLRGDERLSRLPILVLTTEGLESERRASEQAGANAFLVKPFHPRKLLAAVQQLLDQPAPSR